MSLKSTLNFEIAQRRYMTVSEFNYLVDKLGYKRSNAERRVRQSESPNIESVYEEDPPHNIKGYRYIGNEKPAIEIQTFPQLSMKL